LIYGIVFLIVGMPLIVFWAWPSGNAFAWIVSMGLALGGGFAIFESRAGWCVIRAMGMKTRF